MMRVIEEDHSAAGDLLRRFAWIAILSAIVIHCSGGSLAHPAILLVLVLVPVLITWGYYYIAPDNRAVQRRFRIYLSLITVPIFVVLTVFDPLSRTLDIRFGFLCGVGGGLLAHVVGMLSALIANRLLANMRRMIMPNECRKCGYDLTGNISGNCPECGEWVPLYLRPWPSSSNEPGEPNEPK